MPSSYYFEVSVAYQLIKHVYIVHIALSMTMINTCVAQPEAMDDVQGPSESDSVTRRQSHFFQRWDRVQVRKTSARLQRHLARGDDWKALRTLFAAWNHAIVSGPGPMVSDTSSDLLSEGPGPDPED